MKVSNYYFTPARLEFLSFLGDFFKLGTITLLVGIRTRVAVDIGGTFTDFVYRSREGEFDAIKRLTTPENPEQSVAEGFQHIQDPSDPIEGIVHATTLATNTFLGQRGLETARTAMLVTKGFKDVISIGRQRRSHLYDLSFEKPPPLIPRRLLFEITERINASGNVLTPLQKGEVQDVARVLEEEGIASLVICFLHSYKNPVHEKEAADIIENELKDVFITESHKICPEYREYERFSTGTINAVLKPQIWEYLQKISREVEHISVTSPPIYIMNNEGGLIDTDEAIKSPVKLLESGPAAGVVGAQYFTEFLDDQKIISFDMGGTTAKVGAIIGSPYITTEYEIGGRVHRGRIVKGSGYPIRLPFIDLVEVSAGGGTEIWVDTGERLRVGPFSVGADPGPACYGLGGKEPTLTDASLVLNRLGAQLGGGAVTLDPALAEQALKAKASKIDESIIRSAYSALRIGNSKMGKAIRIMTVERGFDPREFTIVAFGGMGPMVAPFLAEELGIQKIVIPPYPGVFSSIGLLLSDFKRTFTTSVLQSLNELTLQDLKREKEQLERKAINWLRESFPGNETTLHVRGDLRYPQQSWEIMVDLPSQFDSLAEIERRFNQKYRRKYGYALGAPPELVNLRVTAIGRTDKPMIKFWREGSTKSGTSRRVYFRDGWCSTPIYDLEMLRIDTRIRGPAIFEGSTTTVVVPPEWRVKIEPNYILEEKV